MTFKYLVFVTLLSYVAAQCGKGCLKCSLTLGSQTTCDVCDQLNLYYLDKSVCVQAQDPNCLEIDSYGACTRCIDKFYPGPALAGVAAQNSVVGNNFGEAQDKNSNIRVVCQPVPQILSTANCVGYTSSMICVVCDQGFYLNPQKQCDPVDVLTPNCKEYSRYQICVDCQDGFYLSTDSKKCLPLPSTSQCLAFSNKSCAGCTSGYYQVTSNNRILNQIRLANSTQSLNNLIGGIYTRQFQPINYNYCVPNELVGCQTQKNESTCSVCRAGFYLDSKNQCQTNPYGAINNCEVYNNSPDSCYSCKNYFMRLGSAEPYLCTAVVAIDKCVSYSGSSVTTICTACQTGFYVSGNACVARKYGTIANCNAYYTNDDSCSICTSNYQLITNSTGNSCIALGSNCKVLETAAGSYCKTCVDGYMPSSASTSCITGTITNCLIYGDANSTTYTTTCSVCAAGFGLANNLCTLLPKIFPALTTITNVKCGTAELPMMVSQWCGLNAIPQCQAFQTNTTDSCTQCNDGYQLTRTANNTIVTPNACSAISAGANCASWDETNNICKKCATGYLLYKDTTALPPWHNCVAIWTYANSNCDTKNTIDTDATNPYIFPQTDVTNLQQLTQAFQPCKKCAAGYIPYKLKYACMTLPTITTQTMLVNKNDFTLVANCAVYNQASGVSNVWKCSQCQQGYYLWLDTKTFITQSCLAFTNFSTTTSQFIAFTFDTANLYKNNFVISDTSITNTSFRIRSANVSYATSGVAQTAADFISPGTYDIPANAIGVSCYVNDTTKVLPIVKRYDFAYSNVNPNLSATTTQLIDDPDRVTPNIASCAVLTAGTNGPLQLIDNTKTDTHFCDYYVDNSVLVDGKTAQMSLTQKTGVAYDPTAAALKLNECLRCPVGKQAMISQITAGPLQRNDPFVNTGGDAVTREEPSFISSCDAFAGCDSTKTTAYGIQPHWVKTFSCFFCSSGGVPVMVQQGISKSIPLFYNWSRLNITNDTTSYIYSTNDAITKPNIMCADISTAASIRSTFKINNTITTIAKMPGCGLAVLNTRYSNIAGANAFDNTIWGSSGAVSIANNAALICAACSPNFRPTYYTAKIDGKVADDATDVNTLQNWFVTQCTPITNCTSSTNVLMNGCQKCDSGFAFLAKAVTTFTLAATNAVNQSIDRTYCVKLPDNNSNCYAYSPLTTAAAETYDNNAAQVTFPEQGKCVVCNAGYYLNEIGFCDKITVSGCNTGSFVQHFANDFSMSANRLASDAHPLNLKYIAFFSQFGISECNQCQTGLALFSVYKSNAGFRTQNISNTTFVNYAWTCAASDFVAYLNKTTSWDVKTSRSKYLSYYNYMCNKYEIVNYAAAALNLAFKHDVLRTEINSLASGTPYSTPASVIETTTLANAIYSIQCTGCANNYVLSYLSNYCYPGDLLQNCALAYDYNDCKQCLKNFARVRVPSDNDPNVFVAQCVNMTVPNCSEVDNINTNHSDIPLCKVCAAGYYWNSTTNQCLLGNVPNCLVNTSINQCSSCTTGYALFANVTGISHCFPTYTSGSIMNCNSQIVEVLNNVGPISQLAFKCVTNTCINGNYALVTKTTLLDSYFVCSKFSLTGNCLTYAYASQGIQPITAVPECSGCITNYYLFTDANNGSAKSCKKRFISSSNCLTQNPTSDVCSSLGCASGYYLTAGNFCTNNPTGVYKCAVYNSAGDTCTACKAGFYLDATNQCVAVTTQISFCTVYASATTCKQCYQDSKTSYYLGASSSSCTASNITNCNQWNATGDKCTNCAPGFILSADQSACTKAVNRIPGCKTQLSETICSVCNSGWALNLSQSACGFQNDSNYNNKCANEIITGQPVCQACLPGYSLDSNGTCSKDSLLSNLTNCLMTSEADPTKCLLCMPGSSMTSPGVCDSTSQSYTQNIIAGIQSRIYRGLASRNI